MSPQAGHSLEVWAGIECSLNRVGDQYVDQLQRGGQYVRPDDIDRLAALGVRAVRFPVLWERVEVLGDRAWDWVDDCLERLRANRIVPIVGLLHHGSGPPSTSLIDPKFPELFARFARRVAERYPWIDRFTPINEPLTTARFSTLYGHWYPHSRSVTDFARAMVVQCQATVAAMQAIREVTPGALLVQTEDLGKTHALEALQYQADFENERRWLTFDMLSGRVRATHPMWDYLRMGAVSDAELEALADAPCPPNIVGINHYLTSERFLDVRLGRYPISAQGGNGRHRYADVEAVRVLRDGLAGPYTLLREAWERYRIPVAVTEAHLACTREQQLRWLDEVWRGAVQLQAEGADVVAVTAWSAFGAHDWSSLLTRDDGVYEPGLFDIRAPKPRATGLARMVHSLASRGSYDDPVLRGPGWWRSDARLTYPGVSTAASDSRRTFHVRSDVGVPPLLIVGATGTLGRAVTRACEARGIAYRALGRQDLDIADASAVRLALESYAPWAVVNCAGFVRVDDAEGEAHACRRGNVHGAIALAAACAAVDTRFVTFSTDLVFDGTSTVPYVETDAVAPVCEYGRTKAEAEIAVLSAHPGAFVVRTAAFFGDQDEHNFVTRALRALAAGEPYSAMSDVIVSPTYVPDLVDAMLDLLIDREHGIWHLASDGAVTWEELARRAARLAGVSAGSLCPVPVEALGLPAPRPRNTALASARGSVLPPLDDALGRYVRARAWEAMPDHAGLIGATSPIPIGTAPTRRSTTTHGRTRGHITAGAG